MKFLTSMIALFSVTTFANTQMPPLQPPPQIACSYTQLQEIGCTAVNDLVKSLYPNAKNYVCGAAVISGVVDPATGFATDITFPFSALDTTGKTIALGNLTLNGKCVTTGGFYGSDVQENPIR